MKINLALRIASGLGTISAAPAQEKQLEGRW